MNRVHTMQMKSTERPFNWRRHKVKQYFNKSIDKNIQSILLPLNLLHNIMLCPKYAITNNNIHPNSLKFKLIGLCAAVFYSVIIGYRTYEYHSNELLRSNFNFAYTLTYFDILFYTYSHFMNFILSVMQTKRNIIFVLNYQKVHRFFDTSTYFPSIQFWNWFSVLLIIIWHVVLLGANVSFGLPLYFVVVDTITLTFDVNVIYAIRLIRILKNNVALMNSKIKSLCDVQADQKLCNKLWKTYRNLLKCYDYYKGSYQQTVSV